MVHPPDIRTWNWRKTGEPAPVSGSASSLDEASSRLPQGVYTTLRTFGGHGAVCFDDHLDRLEESARREGREIRLDRPGLRRALRLLLPGPDGGEVRIRLTLDLSADPGAVYFSLEPLAPPPEWKYARGVRVVTCALYRSDPLAKSTAFIPLAETARQGLPPGVEEALMTAGGAVSEGLSSNFFAAEGSRIFTAGSGVLEGITRRLVLLEIHRLGLDIVMQAPLLARQSAWTEAWITSSTRGVMPVVEIDGRPVGAGIPGQVRARVAAAYDQRLLRQVQPV